MSLLRMILLGLSAVGMVMPGAVLAQTQTLVDVATISMSAPGSPRMTTDGVCANDGNDLVCDRTVYITSSSRVGIGGRPIADLHVFKAGTGGTIAAFTISSTTDQSGLLFFAYTNDHPTAYLRDTAMVYAPGNTSHLQLTAVSSTTGSIRFTVGDFDKPTSEYLRIDNAGRIGVGLHSRTASTTLHVSGSLRLATEASATLAVCDADRTGAIRYTGGDFWFCRNGSNWETLGSLGGGIASPTNVPAFHVKLSADQSVTGPADLPVGFNTKDFDTLGDFNTGTHQFKPSIAGRYLITVATRCWLGNGGCNAAIQKNGVSIAYGGIGTYSVATTVIQMNGTTDYVQGAVYVGSFTEKVMAHMSHMSGSLLASGNGLISGSTALGDRITSGTSAVVVNSATGIVSITQLGAVASYVHPSIGFVGPGVSTTGAVSTSRVYLSATANQCATAADIGSMFRSATTGKLQICADRN